MGGDAERGEVLRERARRATGSVTDRVESLVQPVPGHELADIRFERRTSISPRSTRALWTVIAALVVVVGGGMLISQLIGGGGDEGVVTGEGLSPTVVEALPTVASTTGETADQAIGVGDADDAGTGTVVVAVQGMVGAPGLRTVPAGTRVGEVLDLAGGLHPDARQEGINLAEKVVDGLQIVVDPDGSRVVYPGQSAGTVNVGTGPAQGTGPATVNINTADAATLCTLSGVGQKTAEAIIAWREANGPFASPDQLMEVKGIGAAKFEAMKDGISV